MKSLLGTIAAVGTLILFAGTIALLLVARPTADMKCECLIVRYMPPTKTKFDHDPSLRKAYLSRYKFGWESHVMRVSHEELKSWIEKQFRNNSLFSFSGLGFGGREQVVGLHEGKKAGRSYISALIKHGRHDPSLASNFALLKQSICDARAKRGSCFPYHADCTNQLRTSSP